MHGCMDDLTSERSFDKRATWILEVLGSFFTTRHWQTTGRLVQELNVRTLYAMAKGARVSVLN